MSSYPDWLRILSWACLSVSFVCAAITIGDELRRPQKMMIMNFVWPITALYLGPARLWGYFISDQRLSSQGGLEGKNAAVSTRDHVRKLG